MHDLIYMCLFCLLSILYMKSYTVLNSGNIWKGWGSAAKHLLYDLKLNFIYKKSFGSVKKGAMTLLTALFGETKKYSLYVRFYWFLFWMGCVNVNVFYVINRFNNYFNTKENIIH